MEQRKPRLVVITLTFDPASPNYSTHLARLILLVEEYEMIPGFREQVYRAIEHSGATSFQVV